MTDNNKISISLGITCLLIIAMIGFFIYAYVNRPIPDLPPKFKLVCSVSGEKFGFIDSDGLQYLYVYNTKRDAIEHAIGWYKFKESRKNREPKKYPRDEYEWKDCIEATP